MSKFINQKAIIFIFFFILTLIIFFISQKYIDNKVNDFFIKQFTAIQNKKSPSEVVLVVVDDKSVERIAWPWQRSLFSDIFNFLEYDCKVKAVVFQNVVTMSDTYNVESDNTFYSNLRSQNRLINSFVFLSSNLIYDVLPKEYTDVFNSKIKIDIENRSKVYKNATYKAIIKLPKLFLENAKNLASIALVEDDDKILRNYMPVVIFKDKVYPSVALSAYSMYKGKNKYYLYDNYLCDSEDCTGLKLPVFPKSAKDYIGNEVFVVASLLNWYKPTENYYSHKKYSAIDILESYNAIKNGLTPKINPQDLKDKIVIVGLNADKNVWEQLSQTPVLEKQADIDIHAVMIDNLISNKFFSVNKFDYTFIITFLFCFFIIKGFKGFKENLIYTSAFAILYFGYYVYEYFHYISIPIIAPIITIYFTAVMKYIYSIITTDKNTEKLRNIMGKYFSKDVMKKIITDADTLRLGGVRAIVTILFVDIRNFTQISENLSPQEVSSVLNEYFSTVEPIVGKYNGIVNKYIGDGLLAVFGEPIKSDNHAYNAVKCASEIIYNVKNLREKLIAENKPRIDIGIGINTGEVFAGNIGSEERLEYTVIGDNVNLASRIEAFNHILKTQFLISEYTYEKVKDCVEVVKLSQVNIKGKSKPIDIYEVLRIK